MEKYAADHENQDLNGYWSFKNGALTYLVSELGCVERSTTPKEATGRFVIDPDTPNEKVSWCFD